MPEQLLEAAGRRCSPVTMPEFHGGRPPRNKWMPADPPAIEVVGRRAPRRRRRARPLGCAA
jgi:hypothetical protein